MKDVKYNAIGWVFQVLLAGIIDPVNPLKVIFPVQKLYGSKLNVVQIYIQQVSTREQGLSLPYCSQLSYPWSKGFPLNVSWMFQNIRERPEARGPCWSPFKINWNSVNSTGSIGLGSLSKVIVATKYFSMQFLPCFPQFASVYRFLAWSQSTTACKMGLNCSINTPLCLFKFV